MTDAAELVKLADPRMKAIYDKLAAEGGGTWATYMMLDIEQAVAAQQDGVWQPIDSAPKDGTRFLAYGTTRGGLDPWTDVCAMENISSRKNDPTWVVRATSWNWDYEDHPEFTHWRDLPPPPL